MSSIFQLRSITETEIFLPPAANEASGHPKWENVATRKVLSDSVRNGAVSKMLTDLGYRIGGTATAYRSLQFDNVATADDAPSYFEPFGRPEAYIFSLHMLESSPVLKALDIQFFDRRFSGPAINYSNLSGLPKRRFASSGSRPQFIYEHILAPHPPFNIAADGAPASYDLLPSTLDDGSHVIQNDARVRAQYRTAYVNKLKYVNGAILSHIDRLKETFDGPLVIFLHGDHGGGLHLDQDHLAKTCEMERFKPLFAVFATDETVMAEFADDFNIVNTYRALFRALLAADLPDLPNRHTYVSWEMDQLVSVDRVALDRPCESSTRVWTAEDPRMPSAGSGVAR